MDAISNKHGFLSYDLFRVDLIEGLSIHRLPKSIFTYEEVSERWFCIFSPEQPHDRSARNSKIELNCICVSGLKHDL